jgi:hypothetical protein
MIGVQESFIRNLTKVRPLDFSDQITCLSKGSATIAAQSIDIADLGLERKYYLFHMSPLSFVFLWINL